MTTIDTLPSELEREPDITLEVHPFHYQDPYVNGEIGRVEDTLAELAAMGFYGDNQIGHAIQRVRRSKIDRDNPSTRMLREMLGKPFDDWHSLMPTAAALEPLYDPTIKQLANGGLLDGDIRNWLRNIGDARGLRSRGAIVTDLCVQEALGSEPSVGHRWLSLASGAAPQIFDAISSVRSQGGVIPQATLVDADKNALDLALGRAKNLDVSNEVMVRRMNVLNLKGPLAIELNPWSFIHNAMKRANRLPPASYNLVEAVGILEYLKKDDWEYRYNSVMNTKKTMAGAVTFLQNAAELVQPGGVLLFGNMLDTHPQLGFTLNTIQWPHIQPRSIESMTEIMQEAGLKGQVDVYCPTDGVYAIYAYRKPETNN